MSRFYKERGAFIPEQLVPRPQEASDWHPVSIPEDRPCDELTVNPGEQPPRPVLTQPSGDEPPTAEMNYDTGQEPSDTPAVSTGGEEPDKVPPVDLEAIREEMFNAGMAEGLKQAENDLGTATAALTQACDLINSIRETILKNSKAEMIELTIMLAEKIIRHSVTLQDETILKTVEEAIQKAVKSSEFHVYLHPDDMSVIKDNAGDLVARVSGLENIVIKTDLSVERGGCKVESDNCTVDATLASQIDVVRTAIQDNR